MRRWILFFALVHLSAASAAEPLEKVRLQLKWFSSFQFAGYYMALEKGYYAQSGLDVEIIERDPAKNNILQVAEGKAEYGVADSAVLLYRAQGKPIKILASIFQHSPLVFISKKQSGIVSPLEMKGKIISYQKGIDDAPLVAMLNEAGLSEADYQLAEADFTGQAFLRGETDVMSAYLSNQPYAMKELGVEINVINPLNYGVDFYGDNLFTTERELEDHPERAQAFLEASLKGWKYALAHKEETIAVLLAKHGVKRTEQHLAYEAGVIEKMMVPDMVEIGYTSIERFYRIAEIYQGIGKIDKHQAQEALTGLVYNPDDAHDHLRYLYISLAVILFFVIAVFGLIFLVRHFKRLVAERTEKLSVILDNVVDGIVSIDERGIIQSFNHAAETIFGYQENEVVGKSYSILLPESYNDTDIAYIANLGNLQIAGRGKSGITVPIELAVSRCVQNRLPLFIGVVRDISERNRIDQLKNEFVSTVSHELRTPLTAISGSLGLISGGALGELPERARPVLDIAYRNSQRLSFLINDLLDMEKLVAGKMHFDIQRQFLMPLLEQSIEGNSAYGGNRHIKLLLTEVTPEIEVAVDGQRLLQVLSNLLSNAIKYSPDDGVVEITTRVQDSMVRVSVTDHGPGISAEFRERIFQKFSQADSSDTRRKSGTGLGLAISREMIGRMNGRIGFNSVEGQGACFYFELPIAK